MDRPPRPGTRFDYGAAPEQFGELRLPAGSGPFPVAVVAHGGWWRSLHDLAYAGHLAAALADDGFATWNIEYRRVGNPNGGYPHLLHDVCAALAKLPALARDYPLDLTRIVVTGHSAGGHIAAWLAAKQMHRELDRFGITPPVIGAVPVAGVLDLERAVALGVVDGKATPVIDFLGGSPHDVPSHYALASPVCVLPTGVPIIAIHGTADANVPLELSQRYVERARAAGDPAEFIEVPGADHFDIFDPSSGAGAFVRRAVRQIAERYSG
jgi:acetyl esterase/lipase